MSLLPPRALSAADLEQIRHRADGVLGRFEPSERDGLIAIADRVLLLSHLAFLEEHGLALLEERGRGHRLELPDDAWQTAGVDRLAAQLQDEAAEAPDESREVD